MPTPRRTADTMSEAIAIASPNGRMSKRTHDAACKRLSAALFGPDGLRREEVPQPTERNRLLTQAKRLREMAALGMSPRKFTKEAARLEAAAEALS